MLVIRTSDGRIRWMDISAYLKRESAARTKATQIAFDGAPFDALRVQELRSEALKKTR